MIYLILFSVVTISDNDDDDDGEMPTVTPLPPASTLPSLPPLAVTISDNDDDNDDGGEIPAVTPLPPASTLPPPPPPAAPLAGPSGIQVPEPCNFEGQCDTVLHFITIIINQMVIFYFF